MGTLGWHPIGDPFPAFRRAYEECAKTWGDDPAFAGYRSQIDDAMRGLTLVYASPGQRAALQEPD
jgi:hypothetical protein